MAQSKDEQRANDWEGNPYRAPQSQLADRSVTGLKSVARWKLVVAMLLFTYPMLVIAAYIMPWVMHACLLGRFPQAATEGPHDFSVVEILWLLSMILLGAFPLCALGSLAATVWLAVNLRLRGRKAVALALLFGLMWGFFAIFLVVPNPIDAYLASS